MKDQSQLNKLLEKSEWTATEMQWLLDHLENPDDSELKHILQQQFSDNPENSPVIPKHVSDKVLKLIHQKITPEEIRPGSFRISLRTISIAASLLGILAVATFLLINKINSKQIVKTESAEHTFKNDVDPGGNKATLTLADGSVILLDDAKNGILARQGDAKVIKLDGKLLYDLTTNTKQIVYNTISTPKGGQYQLELPDGSLVWLNATSSIRFPTSFVEYERRVEISGEAYLEVAKNPAKPFVVDVNGSEIQVLGTHFNINAYSDEENMKTTLLEGSIRFVSGNNGHMLQPGQQSQLTKDGTVKVMNNVDVDEVVAWKNGMFSFDNAGIEAIMRQLSRWYDVEVDYKGRTDDLFIAEMHRNIKLSDVLKALELTGKVKFEIEGKKIIVMP